MKQQDRPGQPFRANTWGAIILNAIPTDQFVTTRTLFDQVAAKFPALEYQVCQKMLTACAKRNFIERNEIMKRGTPNTHRRIVL